TSPWSTPAGSSSTASPSSAARRSICRPGTSRPSASSASTIPTSPCASGWRPSATTRRSRSSTSRTDRCSCGWSCAGDHGRLSRLELGDIVPQDTLEATHRVQKEWMQQLLRDGKRVVVLGGGNDISYPDCAALADVVPNLLAFNIDAHFDVREDTPCNSGTPY